MTIGRGISRVMLTTTLFVYLGIGVVIAAPQIQYASPMGDENWRMNGTQLRCGLALTIPNYGIGYFEQYATKRPHFILRKWDQVQRAIPAQVIATPPIWKPNQKQSYAFGRVYIKPGEFGLFLDREPTLKILTFLSQGYQINVNYLSEQGFGTSVSLSPIRFRKVYSEYQNCVGNLLTFDYADVKESVFHFGMDSRALSDADKNQLRRVAKYVEVDTQIDKIEVVGYADESGRKGYNNAISEYRAKAVKNYLLWLGVPKSKLNVTWVGAKFPVGRNDTEEGRAANRRVTITLIKK
jgi:outer membrane protein OmpA-like peptidoglycan-associated protein